MWTYKLYKGCTESAVSSTLSRANDAPPIEQNFSGCYQYCGARTTLQEAGKRRQALTVGTRRAGFAILRIESTRTTTEVKPIIFWSTGNTLALGKGVKSNNYSIGVNAAPCVVSTAENESTVRWYEEKGICKRRSVFWKRSNRMKE